MTDTAIIQQYEDFLDGQSTLSQALEIQLANNAKNKLETELKLQIHKKLDTSQTATVGGTYTTAYTLPADFFMGVGTIYVSIYPYREIPFEQREMYRYTPRVYHINYSTNQLFLCGTNAQSNTITIPYFYVTTDITSSSITAGTTTVTWPARFHSLIPMEMARMYYAIDAGDKGRAWDDRWQLAYQELKNQLINWDTQLKLSSNSFSTPYGEVSLNDSFGIPLALM